LGTSSSNNDSGGKDISRQLNLTMFGDLKESMKDHRCDFASVMSSVFSRKKTTTSSTSSFAKSTGGKKKVSERSELAFTKTRILGMDPPK